MMKRMIVEQYINGNWVIVFVGTEMNTDVKGFDEKTEINNVFNLLRGESGTLLTLEGKGTLVCKNHGPIRICFADSLSCMVSNKNPEKQNKEVVESPLKKMEEPALYTTAPEAGIPVEEFDLLKTVQKIDRRRKIHKT